LKLGGFSNAVLLFCFIHSFQRVGVSVLLTFTCHHQSWRSYIVVIRPRLPRSFLSMQQANQMCFSGGVKEEMVMINPARRDGFISKGQ
jgi:hypothetical protein